MNFGLVSIAQIDLSVRHALAVTKEGTLYSWGSNDQGALGYQEKPEHIQYTPRVVEYFKN